MVQSKPTPSPAKALSAIRSESIQIEASVGPHGACRECVLTAHCSSAPFSGSSTESRGSALSREALRLLLVRQASSQTEILLHRASRATTS